MDHEEVLVTSVYVWHLRHFRERGIYSFISLQDPRTHPTASCTPGRRTRTRGQATQPSNQTAQPKEQLLEQLRKHDHLEGLMGPICFRSARGLFTSTQVPDDPRLRRVTLLQTVPAPERNSLKMTKPASSVSRSSRIAPRRSPLNGRKRIPGRSAGLPKYQPETSLKQA